LAAEAHHSVRVRWGLLVIPFLGHSDATEHSEPNRIPVFTLGAMVN
jgi:hypothetical protein